MPRLWLLVAAALLLLSAQVSAQSPRAGGIVRDSATGEPLAGATVAVVGTTAGSTTDEEGRFSVQLPGSGPHMFRVSFIGYAEREVAAAEFQEIFLIPRHVESEIVVITGTRTVRSVDNVPVRVEAIPEEEVEEKLLMTPSSVAMLLNESTGMRVQTTSAASSTANLRIQGLSGRYTQILNDGIPSLGGLSAGLSLTQLVPLDLRQVEVMKGATSSLYGSDAIAGVVNFLPKLPGEHPETSVLLNATTQAGLDAAAYHSGHYGGEGLSILTSLNRQYAHDVDDDGFADVARFDRVTVTPRVYHRFSEQLSGRGGLTILEEDRKGGATGEVPPLAGTGPLYTEELRTSRLELFSHLEWVPAPGQALAVKLAWLRADRDATFGADPFDGTQHVVFADAQYSVQLPGHDLLAGAAYRSEDFRDRTPGVPLARSYRWGVPSLFLQDEILAAEWLTVLAGGRLDVTGSFGTLLVPRFSVMVRPVASTTFRVGAGAGYRTPTIFIEEVEEAGFRNLRPIGELHQEEARSVSADLNWRGLFGPVALDCNAAFFATDLDHAVHADEDSLAADVLVLRNSPGTTRSRGGELSLRVTYDDFKASFGYTYLWATDDAGAEIDLNPRHAFGAVAVWEQHEEQFKVGLENYWTGSQRVSRNPYRTITPSYWITGLIAEKGFGALRVFVNCENIFDTRQTRFEPVFTGDLTVTNIRLLPVYAPLEGRVINGGVRLVFR